ncbi:RHS repeat-associated core domain-containing protein, partial [Mucilaginibacter sp. HC2]|uniref:RHS repeat domain-containing protein n=1 Tax=Mucilaginibacter inviolabilis TaxID=2714892 RepID=UPI00140874E0
AGNLNNHYSYYYDQLNRLTSAGATTGNNETGITYDMMGNITALKRDKANTPVDQLSYTYTTGTNTLQSVTDATANDYGQMHGTTSYTYDGNGNLLTDNSKGITGISYNLLNLPQAITGKSTTYTYDATGQKLSRLINTAKTDYISGIQYDGTSASSTITFIQTEEGRALPKDATSYNYEYSLTDHLGNSRVNFDTGTGTTRQVQVDDYYAFGMEISTSVASPKNEYLYNKKELQENLGLYDYGARFYDPVIARWTSIDPLAEKGRRWSPYVYGEDDPIGKIDPDGMEVEFAKGTSRQDKKEYMKRQRELNRNSETAKKQWKELKKSDNVFTIHLNQKDGDREGSHVNMKGDKVDPKKGNGADIFINLNEKSPDGAPQSIIIGHEQKHAIDMNNGVNFKVEPEFGLKDKPIDIQNAIFKANFDTRAAQEKSAGRTENLIRSEFDPTHKIIPLRKTYDLTKQSINSTGYSETTVPINLIDDEKK